MIYCHILFLCIQAPEDFGLTLAYAAPEDVCRLGRGECCARNAAMPQRHNDKDTPKTRLCVEVQGEDGAYAGAREEKAARLPTHRNWAQSGFQIISILVHLSKASTCRLIPYAKIWRLIPTFI